MRLIATICMGLALLLGSAGMSWGANFEDGVAAFESGDYATALIEWVPLAEQGNANAQYFLGFMYSKGEGIPQDAKTAVKWYTLAAEQGDANAQFSLGVMYKYGQGIPRDYKTALKWHTLAAEQGDAYAQSGLGLMYFQGQGALEDPVYAHMWVNLAASNGDDGGVRLRNLVEATLTPSQIEKAQDLARECVSKEYKGC